MSLCDFRAFPSFSHRQPCIVVPLIWKMPWAGNPRVNLQEGSGGKAKAYQVQQLLKAIDRLETERAAAPKAEIPKPEATVKRKKKG